MVGSPAWTRHLRALANALRDRRTTLLKALSQMMPDLLPPNLPRGGYHLWLRLPDGSDERAIAANALRHGVALSAGAPYFTVEAPAPYLRLSYVSTPGTAQLEEGIQRFHRSFMV